MTAGQWIGLALILIALVILGALIYGYRRELEELAADLNEARDEINGLREDQAQAEKHLNQLANFVVELDAEQPATTGRHRGAGHRMSSPETPIWCPRCGEYRALPHLKYCPVCLDIEARKDKR